MLASTPVGREAQTKKYDILTALGAHACAAEPGLQRLTLRLITLVTARYNWRTDELTLGRRDIARLWGVDERTVKREFARLKALGWVVVKRAGVRGRVTAYGLDLAAMLRATEGAWPAVGPDFVARMQAMAGQGGAAADPETPAAPQDNIVPFPARIDEDGTPWPRARALLAADDPSTHRAWLAALRVAGAEGERLDLLAPSKFHARYVETHLAARILAALQRVAPGVRGLRVLAP